MQCYATLFCLPSISYLDLSESASNFAFIVGLPRVNFLIVRSSALLLAKRRLFSDDNNASLVF